MTSTTAEPLPPVRCYVCGCTAYSELLRKRSVYIFTDLADDQSLRHSYPCMLNQCISCGHVYEPINLELRRLFGQIYRSADAQGPSPMGVGQWGMQRAERLFFDAVDLGNRKSAIEIGCGDGYLLQTLKARGFERLIGFEPSAIAKKEVDGIRFINDFVDSRVRLEMPVDLAYSIAVFEHIEDINGVLAFCRRNLTEDGELFFVVPNAEQQLETGDPGLFIHQHVHYFTAASITRLLATNGFRATSIVSTPEAFLVTARKGVPPYDESVSVRYYDRYQQELEKGLDELRLILAGGRVIMHGACNSLNNISGWIDGSFELVDNDRNKQGKTYFGRIVLSPDALTLTESDTVVIVPTAYWDAIRSEYVKRGFGGRILRLGKN